MVKMVEKNQSTSLLCVFHVYSAVFLEVGSCAVAVVFTLTHATL